MIKKTLVLMLLLVLIVVPVASSVQAQNTITLTYLVPSDEINVGQATALAEAYMAQHPNVEIVLELQPGGAEGDNIVKTRLATGDMTDIFYYNVGALLVALNPSETLVDISDQPYIENIQESFLTTVSSGDGIYGVPVGTAMGGGILYNRVVYEDLGLEVPRTWDEFVANNEVIAEAGIAPLIARLGDSWTSQLLVLADHYNVAQEVPGFEEAFTLHEATIAGTPAAVAGFEHLQQGYELGWWQEDYATELFESGLELLANGEAAHFPMLTFAMSNIANNFPDQAEDIGFFAQPGTNADANGVTIWMPQATYIPQTTEGEKLEVALDFLGFIASVEGTDILTEVSAPQGPYLINGATLPDDILPAIQDLAAYVDAGNSHPALEFLSPVKGPNLQQITVAVGTGQMDAQQAAEDYDRDVERQAQQLGLPGWD